MNLNQPLRGKQVYQSDGKVPPLKRQPVVKN